MDVVAHRLGIDPAELRRRNLLRDGERTATGQVVNDGTDRVAVLERALALADYDKKRAANKAGGTTRRGIGIATFHHGAGFTGSGEVMLSSRVDVAGLALVGDQGLEDSEVDGVDLVGERDGPVVVGIVWEEVSGMGGQRGGMVNEAGHWPEGLWSLLVAHGVPRWALPPEVGGAECERPVLLQRYARVALWVGAGNILVTLAFVAKYWSW